MKKIFLALAAIFITGCVSFSGGDSSVDMKVVSAGNTTPLSVHFFTLESDAAFRRLDYVELMRKKSSKLNGDIVSYAKRVLSPGGTIRERIRMGKNERYIAVVVGFRDVDSNDNWRYVKKIYPGSRQSITLRVGNQNIY